MQESNSEGNLTNGTTTTTTTPSPSPGLTDRPSSASNRSYDHHKEANHVEPTEEPASQNAAQDSDSMDAKKPVGYLIGAGVLVVLLLLFLFLWRRRRRQIQLEAQTPSLGFQRHHQLDSASDRLSCAAPIFSLGKHRRRASTTTTRSSISATTTTTLADGVLVSTVCMDPAIVAVRIPLDQINVGSVVGRGGFGEVHRGSYHDRRVAVKRLLPDRRADLVHIEALLLEAQFMASLKHAHIVEFVGVAWDSLQELCLVSEFMDGGDLRALLKRFARVEHRLKGFDADKTRIAMDIADALAYLHSQSPPVMHRDLKSRNVLLDKHRKAKLADFGIARERIDSTMTAGVGSSMWMAPEVLVGERYDEKADIYSFGVVLSELDTHQSPYSRLREPQDGSRGIPNVTLMQLVAMGKVSVEFSTSSCLLTTQMIELGQRCVAREPSERPTAVQLLLALTKITVTTNPK